MIKIDTYIAFYWRYDITHSYRVQVARVNFFSRGVYYTNFKFHSKDISYKIKLNDIIAYGDNENGTISLNGWKGWFIPLQYINVKILNELR